MHSLILKQVKIMSDLFAFYYSSFARTRTGTEVLGQHTDTSPVRTNSYDVRTILAS